MRFIKVSVNLRHYFSFTRTKNVELNGKIFNFTISPWKEQKSFPNIISN